MVLSSTYPNWAQAFHKTAPNAKPPQQIYRSLETFDKLVACKKADAETRMGIARPLQPVSPCRARIEQA